MNNVKRYSRRYVYKMRHKYRQDPFAFIILWVLFFSAIFLVFAFRGLIATSFMKKIDINESYIPIVEEVDTGENLSDAN